MKEELERRFDVTLPIDHKKGKGIAILQCKMCGGTQILPRPFADFLLEDVKRDAVADFKKWDEVLLQSYGERKFIPLAMTQEEVYSRSGEN